MNRELTVQRTGVIPFVEGLALQSRVAAERASGACPDTLLLVEHPPTYTKGRRADLSELPMGIEWYERQGIEVHEVDRGGQVTYHGPGQLVAYPIVDLGGYGDDVHLYVRNLEQTMIAFLRELEIDAGTIEGLTGVWTGAPEAFGRTAADSDTLEAVAEGRLRKIGSIGIHVRSGVTTHGLSVNIECDLQPFEWIVPCGIEGCRATSVLKETGRSPGMDLAFDLLTRNYCEIFGRQVKEPQASNHEVVAGGD
jgi:lipoyl(octanoyl) transferase